MATPSGGPATGLPWTSNCPVLISVRPAMQRRNVVLPQPLGPTMQRISSRLTVSDNWRNATTVPSRNSLDALSATMIGLSAFTLILVLLIALAPGRVALHAARIGGGAAALAVLRRRGEAAFRPFRFDLDDVAALGQFVAGFLRDAPLDLQHARPRGARPERDREMLGVPGRRVDRLLQVHAGVDVAQEELRGPLVLLVAAGRPPGQIRLAVAQRHAGAERGAGALAWGQRCRMVLLQPEHLRPAAKAEAELGDDRRGLQP